MKKNALFLTISLLALIPACGGSGEITKKETIDRIVKKAQSSLDKATTEFSSSFYVLSISSEKEQSRELKKVVLKKAKEWHNNRSWFRFSWLNFTTSLNDFKDIPFHAFEYSLTGQAKLLSNLAKRLDNIKVIDVTHLKESLKTTENNMKKLAKLAVKHDRYLQEDDKICITQKVNAAADTVNTNLLLNQRHYC